jgi:hypothetical protein
MMSLASWKLFRWFFLILCGEFLPPRGKLLRFSPSDCEAPRKYYLFGVRPLVPCNIKSFRSAVYAGQGGLLPAFMSVAVEGVLIFPVIWL